MRIRLEMRIAFYATIRPRRYRFAFRIVGRFAACVASRRPDLFELQHQHHLAVATERDGRTSVQRLRPLLQTTRRQPAINHEEGEHSGTCARLAIPFSLYTVNLALHPSRMIPPPTARCPSFRSP